MIVPCIHGCGVQKYVYVPRSVKVYSNDSPAPNRPESNRPSGSPIESFEVPEVTVWTTASWFTHVTVVPAGIVRSFGKKLNAEFGSMVTHWDLRLKPVPTAETWNLGLAVVMPVEQVIDLVQRST